VNYFHKVGHMKEINPDIDFADSTYKSCELSNSQLKLNIISWDNKAIEIMFSNTILLHYRIGSFVSKCCETNNIELINEAINRYYEIIPTSHDFKSFTIVDIDDKIMFEIVAEDAKITKSPISMSMDLG